jgi:hypothetical protein
MGDPGLDRPLFVRSLLRQAHFEEGRLIEARRIILILGTDKFGAPSPWVAELIEATYDLEVLRRTVLRVLRASTWQELLAPEA